MTYVLQNIKRQLGFVFLASFWVACGENAANPTSAEDEAARKYANTQTTESGDAGSSEGKNAPANNLNAAKVEPNVQANPSRGEQKPSSPVVGAPLEESGDYGEKWLEEQQQRVEDWVEEVQTQMPPVAADKANPVSQDAPGSHPAPVPQEEAPPYEQEEAPGFADTPAHEPYEESWAEESSSEPSEGMHEQIPQEPVYEEEHAQVPVYQEPVYEEELSSVIAEEYELPDAQLDALSQLVVAFSDERNSHVELGSHALATIDRAAFVEAVLPPAQSYAEPSLAALTMLPTEGSNSESSQQASWNAPSLAILPKTMPLLHGAVGQKWVQVDVGTSTGHTVRLCYTGDGKNPNDRGSQMVFVRAKLMAPGQTGGAPCQQKVHNIENFSFQIADATSITISMLKGGGKSKDATSLKFEALILP